MSEIRSYHGHPVLKAPVWTWEIPCYLFTGGLAGASAGLAHLAELRGNEVLARRAWALSLAAVTASPALLVSDLGRPERFLNMLRMFKPTSPMSVGSWILTASGASTALAAANAWTGAAARPARLAKPAAALLGLPLSSYTAALLSNTANPVWHEAHRTLPSVFVSGAALSAGAAAVIATPRTHARPARRLAIAAALAELALQEVMERRLGEHGEPYRQGRARRFGVAARVLIPLGTTIIARRGASSRTPAVLGGGLLLAGALAARWSVFAAGVQAAADPRYVLGPQRERIERGQTRGGARRHTRYPAPQPEIASPAPRS